MLSVIIFILAGALVVQQGYFKAIQGDTPKLGQVGSEIYHDGELPKAERKPNKYMAVSIPSVFVVVGDKAQISVKNTGEASLVPSVSINGKEVYRASQVLPSGKTVTAVIPVTKGATKCVTLLEAVEGGKFTVTSKLERR